MMFHQVKYTLIWLLAAAFLFSVPVQASPPRSMPSAAGYNLIVGTWKSRYGKAMHISMDDIDGTSYTVYSVLNDGFTTVVRVVLHDKEKTMLSLAFPNGNGNYVMVNNLTTGRFADAMDFTRQSSFSH